MIEVRIQLEVSERGGKIVYGVVKTEPKGEGGEGGGKVVYGMIEGAGERECEGGESGREVVDGLVEMGGVARGKLEFGERRRKVID